MRLELYAVMAEETPGEWYLVSIKHPLLGHLPIVGSSKKTIEMGFELVGAEVKEKGNARVVKFVEVGNE